MAGQKLLHWTGLAKLSEKEAKGYGMFVLQTNLAYWHWFCRELRSLKIAVNPLKMGFCELFAYSIAAINRARGAGFRHDHFRQERQFRF